MPKAKAKKASKAGPAPAATLKKLASELATVEPKKLKAGTVKATDYSVVLPVLQSSLKLSPGGAVDIYEKNKGLIEILLGSLGSKGEKVKGILALLAALLGSLPKKEEPAAVAPTPAPATTPEPAPALPPPASPSTPLGGLVQGYPILGCQLSMFSRDKGTKIDYYDSAAYKAKITGNGGAQMKGDKAHFNITPRDTAGREIGPGDPRHLGWDERGYPWMRYEWEIEGQQQQDSGNDHFILSSIFSKISDPEHVYDNGCTPTLKLETPWGQGKGQARFRARIDAEHNGGFGTVYSPWVSWFVD
jgi:hypothetical protein